MLALGLAYLGCFHLQSLYTIVYKPASLENIYGLSRKPQIVKHLYKLGIPAYRTEVEN